MTETLQIHDVARLLESVVGPGARAVVWVQGCRLACEGCMVPETWSYRGGRGVSPRTLAIELLEEPGVEGITVSGGEPTDQAEAVAELLVPFRERGLDTWVYSGYTLEELIGREDPAVERLLQLTDVLVDGRYIAEEACTSGFRGSRNQRLIPLTAAGVRRVEQARGGTVEVEVGQDGRLRIMGVTPKGFMAELEERLLAQGLRLEPEASPGAGEGAQ